MQNGIRPYGSISISPKVGVVLSHSTKKRQFLLMAAAPTSQSIPKDKPAPIDVQQRLKRLEAVLFLSPQGITSRRATALADLADATEVRTLIRQLNQLYDKQGKPYRVEEVAGGFAILTRSQFAPWLRKLAYIPGEVRLGRSALETLAVVAYRQPVLRADIEAIRGVGCSEQLKQLMEMDLIRIGGRSEELGRPYLYETTQRFLQMFGLRSADRLPQVEWDQPVLPNELSSEDLAAETEVKESKVKRTNTITKLKGDQELDELLLGATAAVMPLSAIDDDDDDFDDDEDDMDDDDEDLDDWEDDEELEDSDEEDSEDEDADDLDDEEEEWEEVDDEESEDDEESDEDEDDDWDDDEDDWDDDDEEDEDDDWE